MTNPTMSAKERGEVVRQTLLDDLKKVGGLGREETCARWVGNNAAAQIRQAEQAAHQQGKEEGRREALEEAAEIASRFGMAALSPSGIVVMKHCADKIRALAEKETV